MAHMAKGRQYMHSLCVFYASITEMNSTDRLSTSIVDKNDRYELDNTVQIGTWHAYLRV